MSKLAIISTHPIQYYAPVFKKLAQKIDLKIFYTNGTESLETFDKGFNRNIEWDLPLLEGYSYELLKNSSHTPGTHHFKGINNPDAVSRIKAFQPNAILIYGWANQSHLAIIRYFHKKIPVYFRGDSTLLDQKISFKNLLKSTFLKWIYRQVDVAFYVGMANKSYFKKYGLRDNQLVFAPHAIDNDRFSENRSDETKALRNKLGIDSEVILILFAGKLEAKKNPILLLQAFLQLKNEKVHLLFVGNGDLEESLKEMVQNRFLSSLGMTKSVHFMDFQNQTQMPVIYQACDLFCLPSKGPGETWGLAVNEAMVCGKAILVSDKVGCAEDLVDDQNGSVFESENLIDLTQKLIALTNDQSALKIMGENSFVKIQKWSFDQQVEAIISYVNR